MIASSIATNFFSCLSTSTMSRGLATGTFICRGRLLTWLLVTSSWMEMFPSGGLHDQYCPSLGALQWVCPIYLAAASFVLPSIQGVQLSSSASRDRLHWTWCCPALHYCDSFLDVCHCDVYWVLSWDIAMVSSQVLQN